MLLYRSTYTVFQMFLLVSARLSHTYFCSCEFKELQVLKWPVCNPGLSSTDDICHTLKLNKNNMTKEA